MSPWLKAGLIGGAVLIVLNLLGLIPCVGLITCILGVLAYAGIGALAAYWMPPVRVAGQAAGQGALAALVAGLIGGVVNTVSSRWSRVQSPKNRLGNGQGILDRAA